MDIVDELKVLSELEGVWYANVGKRTGERCCAAMRGAIKEIELLRNELHHINNALLTGTNNQTRTSGVICEWINECMTKDEEIELLRSAIQKHKDTFPDEPLDGEFELWSILEKIKCQK